MPAKPLNGVEDTCGTGCFELRHNSSLLLAATPYITTSVQPHNTSAASVMSTANGYPSGNGFPQQVANGLASAASGLAKATAPADGANERIQIVDEKKDFTFVAALYVPLSV